MAHVHCCLPSPFLPQAIALFAPDGRVANVSLWTDIAGLPIAVEEGR